MGTPLLERPASPLERLREAALAYANADDSEVKDAAFRRADDNLRQSANVYARRSFSESVQAGLQAARKAGARIGRKPMVDPSAARAAVAAHGSQRKAARALGVSLWALWRALRR